MLLASESVASRGPNSNDYTIIYPGEEEKKNKNNNKKKKKRISDGVVVGVG
jgi:hypothetical protein